MCRLSTVSEIVRPALNQAPVVGVCWVDTEPLRLAGKLEVVSGVLVSIRPVPGCPSFEQITVRLANGTGSDVVVPLSLLVYVYCPKAQVHQR